MDFEKPVVRANVTPAFLRAASPKTCACDILVKHQNNLVYYLRSAKKINHNRGMARVIPETFSAENRYLGAELLVVLTRDFCMLRQK